MGPIRGKSVAKLTLACEPRRGDDVRMVQHYSQVSSIFANSQPALSLAPGCHRLGLADPPMHFCDIGWSYSVELQALGFPVMRSAGGSGNALGAAATRNYRRFFEPVAYGKSSTH